MEHADSVDKLEVVSKWLLLRLAEAATAKKDIYLRNAIAKNISLVRAIQVLFDTGQFNQAYILFRSLLDRLVYLFSLNDNDAYDTFEEWSFVKTYEHRNNAKADERFRRVLDDPLFKSLPSESRRYTDLKHKNSKWIKPDPETVLKKHGFDFLYKFGYDYASMHTHPMAGDGDFEFYQLTGLKPNPHEAFSYSELSLNTILISTLLMKAIFNHLSFKFMAICYTFLDEICKKANGDQNSCDETFNKIVLLIANGTPLFNPKS
jgi:hypothetical protein